MVRLSIDNCDLVVDVQGWSRLWAFKRRLRVPLSRISNVRREPAVAKGWWKGFRLPATQIPGVILAGNLYRHGGWDFWDVRGAGDNAVTIDLKDGPYRRLIVDVEDPDVVVKMLNDSRGRRD